jgi:hypothetical protein
MCCFQPKTIIENPISSKPAISAYPKLPEKNSPTFEVNPDIVKKLKEYREQNKNVRK